MDSWVDAITAFHFLRPWWLLLIPVLALIIWWLKQQRHYHTGFEQWIDAQLLKHLRVGQNTHSPLPFYGLAIIWLAATLALAGPTWKQLPQPVHESESALVIILDLSPSMMARDNKPSRIVRARLKIKDLLSQRKDGLTALVVYAGESHIVTPLTDDTRTIVNLLSTLEPGLLPIPGSNIEMALTMSQQLVLDSGLKTATFFVVTDGIDPSASRTVQSVIGDGIDLYILGVGTEKGAPIPTKDGFLRDEDNQLINVQRNDATMRAIANASNGTYLPLQADDKDINLVVNHLSKPLHDESRELERNIDQWHEFGPTLLLLLLPLAALSFRRGYLLSVLFLLIPLGSPEPAYAWSLQDLWLTPDQQGKESFEQQDFDNAQQQFSDPRWQGSAAYRNRDYEAAAKAFSQGDSATDHYNRGNALAQSGKLDEAIAAYDKALERQPNMADAIENRRLVQQLQKQQQKDNQPSSSDQNPPENQQGNEEDNSSGNNSSNNTENNSGNNAQSQQSDASENNGDKNNNNQREQNSSPQDESNAAENAESNEQHNESQDQTTQQQAATASDSNDALNHLSAEEKQALEQWLRKVPDDPSGLLRRKFEYEFRKRRKAYQQGDWQLPENNAHKRY